MVSYLRSLVQFSPAAGRAGQRQTDIAGCGVHSPCSGHTGFAPYRGVCAFPVYTAQAPGCCIWSGPCVEYSSSFLVLCKSADSVAPAFCAFPGLSGSGSQKFGRPFPGCGAPFPSAAPARGRVPAACVCSQELASSQDPPGCGCRPTSQSLGKSLDRNWRPVCSVGGGAFSGAEFAPFPSPVPPTSSGDRPALLWSFSVPLFCERPAVRPVNFLACYPTV